MAQVVEAEIKALQDQCAAVQDEVFASFSASLGIASVREYEEVTLRASLEKQNELLALGSQRDKLAAQVEFERRKDLPAAVEKLRAQIADDEKTLAKKLAAQAKLEAAAEQARMHISVRVSS